MRPWNLGNALVLLGLAGLGVTLWWPYATADRVARIESWAELTAAQLHRAIRARAIDPDAPGAAEQILVPLAGGEAGKRLTKVEPPGSAAPGAYFQDKHYHYAVLRSPPPAAPSASTLALEVWAWPSSYLGPGRTAFCFPADAQPVYSRNLRQGYAGVDRLPAPGMARPRPDAEVAADGSYRGMDDERWLRLRTR